MKLLFRQVKHLNIQGGPQAHMQWKAIMNGTLILPDRLVDQGTVLLQGDRIAAFGASTEVKVPAASEIIDAKGCFVGPGFIDIHNHGGGGVWSFDHPMEAALAHLQYGTTGYVPTPAYLQTREEMRESLLKIVGLMKGSAPFKNLIVGIHLEGPFLNPKYGAIRTNIRPVDPEEYREILAIAGPQIKIWTIAPEMPGTEVFLKEAAAYPHIAFSVGHSESEPETMFRTVSYGLKLACHCTNASGTTPAKTRFGGTREVGVDEAALVHDEITAEVIPDRGGAHVRPLMLKLILKTKGIDRVIVITDAVNEAANGPLGAMPELEKLQDFPESNDVNYTDDGELNGSKLTMDRATYNMMRHTGVDIVGAFRMASLNPARMLGVESEMGSIAVGKKANLVIVNETIDVQAVIFEGENIELKRKRG